MKIKALLIDDDFKACDNLTALLRDYCPNVQVQSVAFNLNDATEKVKSLKPDLLFLDMQLENELGFDLFQHVDLSSCKIIVVSAFEDFALKAFQFSAIDFILKPVNPNRLIEAVNKVNTELEKNNSVNNINLLIQSLDENSSKNSTMSKVGIPTVFGSTFIDYNNITRCEADRNYTKIFLVEGKPIMSSKNLSEIESLLPESLFSRVHHSHIINLNQMLEYHKGKSGFVMMSDESKIPISQNKKSLFVKRLSRF